MSSDVPTGLEFVDPNVVETAYRFCLWAAPGEGKSVAATSAPKPILALSADRPSAFAYARRHHGLTPHELREARYTGPESLADAFRYLGTDEGADIRTVLIDPISNIYDALVKSAPKRADGDVDYTWVNDKIMGFITSLRRFDVHLVIVAHEKLNDGKKGDGKLYPRIGGATLISKAMAEMDVVAHIERTRPEDAEPVWFAQVQPTDYLVGKDGTNALGERRVADLSRWVELMREYTRQPKADSETDLPWAASSSKAGADPTAGVEAGAAQADRPEVEPSADDPSQGSGDRPPDDALAKPAEPDAAPAEPTSDTEAQAALARATVAEREPLNAVDWQLLDRLMAGDTAQAAADNLGGTVAAVREHVGAIKVKLGVRTMPAVLELARRLPREPVAP